jgi:DNA-binding LytR/AlgR family response regulator
MIVDDELMAIKVLENHLSKIASLDIVATHNNAMDAFSTLQKQQIDILFLDLQMPKLTGFGLLRTLAIHPHVIITTAHREYALESYEFKVTDYLLKPISFERLLKAIAKIQQLEQHKLLSITQNNPRQNEVPAFFYIRSDRHFIKIESDKVLYIESIRNHVRIVTTEQNYTTLMSIGEMEEKLPPQHFLRIHRSYIVSLSKVNQFTQSAIRVDGRTLPIGNFYKKEVIKRFQEGIL